MKKIYKHSSETAEGYQVKGWVFAESHQEAVQTLQDKLKLVPQKVSLDFNATANYLLRAKLSYSDLADFFKAFKDYMKSGFDLTRIFQSMALLSKNPLLSAYSLNILDDIRAGLTLSEAYEKTKLFPAMAITSVHIGEAAGATDDISARLADYYREKAEFKTTLINSLIYPALTILAALGLCYFVLTSVVPKVKEVVSKFSEVPKLTERVIAVSDFILSHGKIIFLIFLIFSILVYYWKRTRPIDFYTLLLKVPFLGQFFRYFAYIDTFSSLGILLSNGIPLGDSLDVLTNSASNEFIKRELQAAKDKLSSGSTVREAFSSPFFFYEIPTTLAIGEQTGKLGDSFERLAEIYKDRLNILLKRFLTFLEPVILILLGSIILLIALTFMLPIQHAVSNFQLK